MGIYLGIAIIGITFSVFAFVILSVAFVADVVGNNRASARETARMAFRFLILGTLLSVLWPLTVFVGILYMGKAAFSGNVEEN